MCAQNNKSPEDYYYMCISKHARQIAESPTLKLNEEARLLRSQGKPVINLGIGEPQNKAPKSALNEANKKLSTGLIKYGPAGGLPSLKQAIIQYTKQNYDRSVSPENIIVTNGAKQSLFNILFSIIDPDDEVILFAPYWVSYPDLVKMVSGKQVIVTPPDGTFVPDMDLLEKAISARTKAIILNSPNNPSGMIFPEQFISDIVDLCEKKGIYLIMDDIYQKFVFDGQTAPNALKYANKDIENSKIITVNGVSKLYGMTGFRIGWTVTSKSLVKTMTNIQGQTTSCPSIVSQVAAEGALNGDQSVVDELRADIEKNRNVVLKELGLISNVKIINPQGTFYALPDFRAYNQNSSELAQFILKKALVVTVPGSAFGMEGHLRLSYAGPTAEVEEGIRRIRWAIDPNSPKEIIIEGQKLIRDWQ
jgi:aspartate aminotransferase